MKSHRNTYLVAYLEFNISSYTIYKELNSPAWNKLDSLTWNKEDKDHVVICMIYI